MPLQNPQDVAAHSALSRTVHGVGASYVASLLDIDAAIEIKVKLETRSTRGASGDISYTGYGFQPTGLIIIAVGGAYVSVGSTEPALAEHCMFRDGTAPKASTTLVHQGSEATNYQKGVLKTFDADGFTITWTLNGTPTDTTINMHVFAFK